jgi:hypothetical protein
VNDLDTPKGNKSDSNSEPLADVDVDADVEFPAPDQDLKALRHALLGCIGILDRMEQNSRRSASTQTVNEPVGVHRAPKQFEETEVVGDRMDVIGPSPVAKVAPVSKLKTQPKREEEVRKPLQPVNRPAQEAERPKAGPVNGSEDSALDDDGNLQKRLHEMSLLLKRLENQIDGVNEPYAGIE